MTDEIDDSTLLVTEYHPAADHALAWFKIWSGTNLKKYMLLREALASTALLGNRLAQVCNGTLNRIDKGEPVSDRYVLGLVWFVKEMYLNEGV